MNVQVYRIFSTFFDFFHFSAKKKIKTLYIYEKNVEINNRQSLVSNEAIFHRKFNDSLDSDIIFEIFRVGVVACRVFELSVWWKIAQNIFPSSCIYEKNQIMWILSKA